MWKESHYEKEHHRQRTNTAKTRASDPEAKKEDFTASCQK